MACQVPRCGAADLRRRPGDELGPLPDRNVTIAPTLVGSASGTGTSPIQ